MQIVIYSTLAYICNNYNMLHIKTGAASNKGEPTFAISCFISPWPCMALSSWTSSPNLMPLVRFSRHTHSKAFQLYLITKKFIQYSFLPRTIANWNNLPAITATAPSLEIFRQDLQLATLIHIVSFTLSTFPLFKLQLLSFLFLPIFYYFLLQHFTAQCTHTESVSLEKSVASYPE